MNKPTQLTPRDKKFIKAYLSNGSNKRQAAITAGATKASADSTASRILSKAQVRDTIEFRESLTHGLATIDENTPKDKREQTRQDCDRILKASLLYGDHSASVQALTLRAKIDGLLSVTHESQQPITFHLNLGGAPKEVTIESKPTPK